MIETGKESIRKNPIRYRLPDSRESITHKFVFYGDDNKEYKGYITVGLFDDGKPGEIFIHVAKIGTRINGLLNTIAVSVSIGLQYNIPLNVYAEKFINIGFEPYGMTNNPDIKFAKSIVDYIFKWLKNKFKLDL